MSSPTNPTKYTRAQLDELLEKFQKDAETQLAKINAGDEKASKDAKQVPEDTEEVKEDAETIDKVGDTTTALGRKCREQSWKLEVLVEDFKERSQQYERLMQRSDVMKGKFARIFEEE